MDNQDLPVKQAEQPVENAKKPVRLGPLAKYRTPDELEAAIERYFGEDCPSMVVSVNKHGHEIRRETPTISGLAYYLGFTSRQSLYDYEKRYAPDKEEDNTDNTANTEITTTEQKEEKGELARFAYHIKRARLRIEAHYEQNMNGGAAAGSIFALKNMGWMDRQEVKTTIDGSLNLIALSDLRGSDKGSPKPAKGIEEGD